eukprot:CAMPEP_0178379528 /NCGR_PEP_ID=MMETSP0689_2-20121128/4988_1 /TAXON_ID=160604 /ORGANISM="Amphidinium massartii, Strain CS-259" /LENGTH=385 /DNA_ID=CAMNT_0019999631 /DNA_START=129 /DNA_END=1283 /DNA_ORIENTATION=+
MATTGSQAARVSSVRVDGAHTLPQSSAADEDNMHLADVTSVWHPPLPTVGTHQYSHPMAITAAALGFVTFVIVAACVTMSLRCQSQSQRRRSSKSQAEIVNCDAATAKHPSPFGRPQISDDGLQGRAGDVFLVRLKFLCASTVLNSIPVLFGIVVYNLSNSLAIELDTVSALTDILALLVNIAVEMVKRKAPSERLVLFLDLMGAAISLTLLVAVGVYGAVQAIHRGEQPTAWESRVHHLGYMLAYNLVTISCDGLTLSSWFLMKGRMMVSGDDATQDQLNTFSSLMHACVNLVQDLSVTVTIVFIAILSSLSDRTVKTADTVAGDIVGSILVCLCILASAAFMLRESLPVVRAYREMDAENEPLSEPRSPYCPSEQEPESEEAP